MEIKNEIDCYKLFNRVIKLLAKWEALESREDFEAVVVILREKKYMLDYYLDKLRELDREPPTKLKELAGWCKYFYEKADTEGKRENKALYMLTIPPLCFNWFIDIRFFCIEYERRAKQQNRLKIKDSSTLLITDDHKKTIREALPRELNTDEAKAVLNKAIENNLINIENGFYRWNTQIYSKQLLAYFVERMSNTFNLSSRYDAKGNKTINWKLFEKLFDKSNIKSAKGDWMRINTKFTPNGYEEIDALFQ